jgi:hypothetical protein
MLDGWFVSSGFIDNMSEKLEQWGDRMFVSERAWVQLDRLRTVLERQNYL